MSDLGSLFGRPKVATVLGFRVPSLKLCECMSFPVLPPNERCVKNASDDERV